MNLNRACFQVSILVIMLLFCRLVTSTYGDENLVRAKIGILKKSGEHSGRAKAEDRLKAGDLIRIYVHPELATNVYVIHSSEESLVLLNVVSQQISSATVVLPSIQDYYRVDGKSRTEKITIVCSPHPLKQAASIADGKLTANQWMEIEKELIEKSRIDMGQNLQKPFSLAGNVRSAEIADPFVDQLPIYMGNGLLVKTYAFEIEK